MQGWTRARFEAALVADPRRDTTIWLSSRSGDGPVRGPARRLSGAATRGGARLARATVLFGLGSVASGVISGSAMGPAGPAHAAVERIEATPRAPLAMVIEAAPTITAMPSLPTLATEQEVSFEAQRLEAEEFLRFGSRELPLRLVETIVRAANATEVDAIYLMALADKESSFRTDVKASTSSAEGLFQFVGRTWLEMVRTFGARHGLAAEAAAITLVDGKPTVLDEQMRCDILALRREPFIAAVMAAELLKKDAAQIGFRIGRKLNRTELYLAHFLGLEDAARFIAMQGRKRPANAARVFPAAARANAAIFFKPHKRGRRGLSVNEVYAKIDQMIGTRAELYRDVAIQVADAGR